MENGSKALESVRESDMLTKDMFQVLKDEIEDDPGIVLVDGLIKHQDQEFYR